VECFRLAFAGAGWLVVEVVAVLLVGVAVGEDGELVVPAWADGPLEVVSPQPVAASAPTTNNDARTPTPVVFVNLGDR
jgi:hypothetical protein